MMTPTAMTPTGAMFWQIWRGWRWGLVLGAAYLVAAAVLAHLLPGLVRNMPGGEYFLPNAGAELALPCILIGIHLAAAFSLTGADLKERGYWRTMFVLPVRTWALVAWPMLWGSLALAFVWLFVALMIFRPTGTTVPLVWPIAALVVGMTLLQVVSWMPLAQPWLSIVLAVPLLSILAAGAALVAIFAVPEPLATLTFAALVPLHYAAGLRFVAAARRGDAFDWRLWNRLVDWMAVLRQPSEHPFRSAERAQLWFECRSHAWMLPLFTALVAGMVGFISLADKSAEGELPWKLFPMVLGVPPLIAAAMGVQLGQATFPFLATRPIATTALVRSKLLMAIVSALLAYMPVLIVGLLFLLRPGFVAAAREAVAQAGPSSSLTVALAAIVLPILLTWKGLVESLWLGLTGREWIGNLAAGIIATLIGCGAFWAVVLIIQPGLRAYLLSLAPWLIGALLALKALAAAGVIVALARARMATWTALALMLGAWTLVVTGVSLSILYLLPPGIFATSQVLAAIALLVPFARLAGAPLSLDWNRHR